MSDGRKMSGRTVVLAGGPPWGFRMTAGSDGVNSLKISRVNPGSVSAEKVREGDIITSINGQETSILTVQQAQAVLNCEKKELTLVLHNKREKKLRTKNTAGPELRLDQTRLPLPSSPEYILLKRSREKRSGSLSSLHDRDQVNINLTLTLYSTASYIIIADGLHVLVK